MTSAEPKGQTSSSACATIFSRLERIEGIKADKSNSAEITSKVNEIAMTKNILMSPPEIINE
jgi:hypothetical protein